MEHSLYRRKPVEKYFVNMQIRIFTIPLLGDEQGLSELNHFLRANKVIDIRKELAQSGGSAFWTFCITYMLSSHSAADAAPASTTRPSKVDYKEVLDETTFARFARMRKLRKQIAESEAVPAYAVFTDAELAEMAKLEVLDTANMLKIPGIGKKKVEKYGNAFCLTDYTLLDDEESGKSDGTDR